MFSGNSTFIRRLRNKNVLPKVEIRIESFETREREEESTVLARQGFYNSFSSKEKSSNQVFREVRIMILHQQKNNFVLIKMVYFE